VAELINPARYSEAAVFALNAPGKTVDIYLHSFFGAPLGPGWQVTTISSVTIGTPWPSAYKVLFGDTNVNQSIQVGDIVKVRDTSSDRRAYEGGVSIRPKDGEWIYVANDLPSKAVVKVEGFGDVKDEAGKGRKDWILLGQLLSDELDGSVETINIATDVFTVNLNDDTWNLGTGASDDLGHNVTTITFQRAPREVNSNCENNRIWVTLKGIEDNRDSTGTIISNPALLILEILEHPDLLDLDAAFIDSSAFSTAAGDSVISTRKAGFFMLEPRDGMELIQDIARQCHCAIFFDLGKVTIQVLKNTAPASTLTLDTSANDNIVMGTLEKWDSDVDQLVSHVLIKWRSKWDDKDGNKQIDVVRKSSGVEAAFGRRDAEFPVWLYYRRSDVEAEGDFYVTRWGRLYRHVALEGLLDALILQPADWITLTYVDASGTTLYSARQLEVLRTSDRGVGESIPIEARYAAFTF
jgi:hypothetical protein